MLKKSVKLVGHWAKLNLAAVLFVGTVAQGQAQAWELRVCSEPNSLPYSNRQGEGFENRIAELIAQELGAKLTYTWLPQPRAVVRNVLLWEGGCDLIMGVTDGHPGFLTTLSYYRSTYVFVHRADSPFEIRSLDDPVLSTLKIGVQAGGRGISPGTYALANRGLMENQVGLVPNYSSPDPLSFLIEAVIEREVDVAIVWGPVAGYFTKEQTVELEVVPVTPEIDLPFMPMVVPISIGVRPEDEALQEHLNAAITRRWNEIQAILQEYGVPLRPLPPPLSGGQSDVEQLTTPLTGLSD